MNETTPSTEQRVERREDRETAVAQVAAALRAGARRGMTIIEIMVVMGIIAIIGTAIAFGAVQIFGDSQVDAARAQVRTIQTGLDSFYIKYREYPDRLEALVEAGYLEPEQLEDPWKKPIVLRVTGAQSYEVCSGGEDLSVNGQDDICVVRERKGR